MAGTRIYDKGPIAESERVGTQIDSHASSSGFGPFKVQTIYTHINSSTGSSGFNAIPGVNLVSGVFANVVRLPSAANSPGAMVMVRLTSNHVHQVTASYETAGSRPIVAKDGVLSGSLFSFSAGAVDNAAGFWCDGVKWHLSVGSGSITGV